MRRKRRQVSRNKKKEKVYSTNVDTISLNVEQFGPGPAPWEEAVDPRLLRKKGSQICK